MNTTTAWPEDQVSLARANSTLNHQIAGVSLARWLLIVLVSVLGGAAAGFRWFGEGRDYGQYIAMYEIVGRGFWELVLRYEPGFMSTILVFKRLTGLPYEYFAALFAGLSLALKQYLFHKYTRYAFLATFAYLLLLYPIHEYTQIRAGIGIGLGFWGVHLALERRWIPMVICFLLGFSFHYTVALIPAALVPALLLRNQILLGGAGAVGALILYFGGEGLISRFYQAASRFNPLSDAYVFSATRSLEEVNLFSVSNLALFAALALGLAMPWFSRDLYRRVFVILGLASAVAMVLFVGTPVFAHRLKEVLVLSFIFFAYRDARNELEWSPAVLVLLASAATFYSSMVEGIVEFS